MKIAFVLSDTGGVGWYRMVVPGEELERRGHAVSFHRSIPVDRHRLQRRRQPSIDADVLVVQRVSDFTQLLQLRQLRQFQPDLVIIHDLDDNLHELPKSNPCAKIYEPGSQARESLEEACRLADTLVVSTQVIADRYHEFNGNGHVYQNALPSGITCAPPVTKLTDQIRIGWAGSSTHRHDVAMVAPVLESLLRDHDNARLVFFGDDMRGLFATGLRERITYVPPEIFREAGRSFDTHEQTNINFRRYLDRLASLDLDIAIAPIESTAFNAGKSACKLLEYGLAGLPIVASRFGPYRDASPYVCQASSVDAWRAALIWMLSARDARIATARAHQRYILDHHVVSARIDAWERAIASAREAVA